MNICVHENDMATIRFSKNKFYDVMAPFFVHDVVALNTYHVGDLGSGEVVKIVNNFILATFVCAISEGLVLGVRAGVEPGVLFEALSKSSANSFALL